jgi:hypothetical protein
MQRLVKGTDGAGRQGHDHESLLLDVKSMGFGSERGWRLRTSRGKGGSRELNAR